MNGMPTFSIIVPVYNAEKYIDKCIDSVLEQSYSNFELILVNDGSSDNSGVICDKWSQKDERIIVLHKANEGPSEARNLGINKATGEYILFLDADDYFHNYQTLDKCCQNILRYRNDVFRYGSIDKFANGNQKSICCNLNLEFINNNKKNEVLTYLYKSGYYPGAVWGLCIKRTIIIDNKIYFPKGVTAEDFQFIMDLLLCAKSIGAINDVCVTHNKDVADSLTHSSKTSGLKGMYKCLSHYLNDIDIIECPAAIKNQMGYIFAILLYSVNHYPQYQKDLLNALKRTKTILTHCTDKKWRILYILIKLFGLKNTSRILKFSR